MAVLALLAWIAPITPLQAKNLASDRVCDLGWETSTGFVGINRRYAADRTLKFEWIGASAKFPGDYFGIYGMSLDMKRGPDVAPKDRQAQYELGYDFSVAVPRNLLVEIETPGGLLSFRVSKTSGYIPLSAGQLRQILSAAGPVRFRVYRQGGKERGVVREDTFDVSAFPADSLGGLDDLAMHGSAVFDQAMAAKDPPCSFDEFPQEKENRIDIKCQVDWTSAEGQFQIDAKAASWRFWPMPDVTLIGQFEFVAGPALDRTDFLQTRSGSFNDFPNLRLAGTGPRWTRNGGTSAARVQVAEISAGAVVFREWLHRITDLGLDDRDKRLIQQLFKAPGPLTLKVWDIETGAFQEARLPDRWQQHLFDELRGGLQRLREKERDPLSNCQAKVQHYTMGDIVI